MYNQRTNLPANQVASQSKRACALLLLVFLLRAEIVVGKWRAMETQVTSSMSQQKVQQIIQDGKEEQQHQQILPQATTTRTNEATMKNTKINNENFAGGKDKNNEKKPKLQEQESIPLDGTVSNSVSSEKGVGGEAREKSPKQCIEKHISQLPNDKSSKSGKSFSIVTTSTSAELKLVSSSSTLSNSSSKERSGDKGKSLLLIQI